MQARGHGVMAGEGVGGVDRINFGIGSRPGESSVGVWLRPARSQRKASIERITTYCFPSGVALTWALRDEAQPVRRMSSRKNVYFFMAGRFCMGKGTKNPRKTGKIRINMVKCLTVRSVRHYSSTSFQQVKGRI